MTRHKKYKWEIVTKIEKKERGIIVMLDSLENEIHSKKSLSNLKSAKMTSGDSLEPLLEKLDLVFKSRKNNDAYDIYSKFMTFKREGNMTMLDYLLEYKHLYNELTQHDINLPETVLVFQLLEGANLEEDERKLALALGNDLKLKTMKFILKRIFGKLTNEGRNEKDSTSLKFDSFHSESIDGSNEYDYVGRCNICYSMMHSSDTCQHALTHVEKKTKETEEDLDNFNVDVTEDDYRHQSLIEEANSAVINTICKETVAGLKWFEYYKCRLSVLHQRNVETYPSSGVYRFVNGSKVQAVKTAVFPVRIGNTVCKLEAEIVDDDIPLLLGKDSLKKAGTVIDIQNNKAKMFGQDLELHLSRCGNYCVNVFPGETEFMCHDSSLLLDEEQCPFEQKEKMVQLHNQFGHATSENLKRIARSAGIMSSNLNNIIDDVVDECHTCAIVGMSKSDEFNQRLFIGFHEVESNVWFMHIVDEYTRFSNAAIIRNKRATVRTFLKCWVSLFGAPHEIFCDNRNEFTGEDFFEMCESFGIIISKTPPSSPWSNGVSERHNKTLTSILLEIKEDNKCCWENALVWAISAKNAIINHSGLSPAQIAFGRIGKHPNNLINNISGLNTTFEPTNGDMKIVSALQSACRPRDNNKAKEKKTREVKIQRKKSLSLKNEKGIYYQRDVTQHWDRSSKVLVPVLLLRKGEEYVKAHVCRVQSFEEGNSDDFTTDLSEEESGISSIESASSTNDEIVEENVSQ